MGVTRQPSSQTRSEATMDEDSAAPLEGPIRVDEKQLRGHIDEAVRSSVEETLNALLHAEAEQICGAQRYERSADRVPASKGAEAARRPKAIHAPEDRTPAAAHNKSAPT